jgi:predicted dehydrogenase
MRTSAVRIGFIGCGGRARSHLDRFLALGGVAIAGCADPDVGAALALADRASLADRGSETPVPAFEDHRKLLRQTAPDAAAVFIPLQSHYRPTMDALQAGCHVFCDKLSTNLQEASDIVSLARARDLTVGVDRPLRHCPSLVEARRRLAAGAFGPVRMVVTSVTRPDWTTCVKEGSLPAPPSAQAEGGLLATTGDDLIDVLLWTTGQRPLDVAAFPARCAAAGELAAAASIRLSDGTLVALGTWTLSPGTLFAVEYFGELGRMRASDLTLEEEPRDKPPHQIPLPTPSTTSEGNFVAAVSGLAQPACPAGQALETVRLLDAITRSAATGQIVRLV